MKINVTTGTGKALTRVAAYDAALRDAHIGNYNLIYLSSVIPDNSKVIKEKPEVKSNEHGWKLYAVVSEKHEDRPGHAAWSGLGWTLLKGETKGLFVHAEGSTKDETIQYIKNTLDDMKEKRGGEYEEIQYEVIGVECVDKPVCAIVAAVYKSEDWK